MKSQDKIGGIRVSLFFYHLARALDLAPSEGGID